MSNSNQRYGVWDSYNDMALSLSPTSSNPELCMAKGCNELVGASALAMGYRLCTKCIMKHTDALQRRSERSEQNTIALDIETDGFASVIAENAQYLDSIGDRKFKRALQNEENRAQREEWINAIPKEWSV